MKVEKYVGLKYKEKGRDFDGVDCYGLVRLIYKNEFQIDLPSFTSDYAENDTLRIQELIAQYKEGWEQLEVPEEGSIVLFRILGTESHVGVAVSSSQFVHAREGQDSAIENFDAPAWRKRVVGYFKYSEKKSVVLNAAPHPLKTQHYTIPILPGTKLETLAKGLNREYNVPEELKSKVVIILNGRVTKQEEWSDIILNEGDKVEYRAVPAGGALRTIAFIALAVAAPYLATQALGYAAGVAGAAGATIGAGLGGFIYYGTYAATILVGSAIINAIAPIRPPVMGQGKDPGTAERQLMVEGGQNQPNPYGAIPVVLGKVRMTPPLGSNNFLTYENQRDSYLSMLLVWGYGPLSIDTSSLRIGNIPLTSYADYEIVTLDRKTEPTMQEMIDFNAIYGNDITQVQVATELVCDGNPEFVDTTYSGTSVVNDGSLFGGPEETFMNAVFTSARAGQRLEAYFTSNTTNWTLSTRGVTNIVVTNVNSTTKKVTGVATRDYENFFSSVRITYNIDTGSTGTWTATNFGIEPGPWLQASSTETVNSATISLHFPQGLRTIKLKDDGAGDSFPTSVKFRIEYSTDGGTTWQLQDAFPIGGDVVKKDAFTVSRTYKYPSSPSEMIIRVRRETGDNPEDNPNYRYYFTSVLQNVLFTRNARPAVDPLNAKIAKTAFKIKATDQLNGRIDGINAIVQTWCKTWNGTAWVDGATSNPADLFRYVLEHPANPRRITDAASQLNLSQLQYFHEYCESKGFEYNSVLGEQRSILEVLRDICAAGRASPALVDGKWTVVIDEEKPNVIQHFTPHNSWGFEGNKLLPKRPDGLRVTYYDQDNDYQEAEIIVYDTGKDANNSRLFESITLPGVTKKSLVIDHAKWHMAQIKLRPEIYTINVDIEYLVCNRGDRVKVTHDIPMWGIGSGRVKNRISDTKIQIDEQLPLKAGVQYTIRFRSADGGSVVRNVVPKFEDGYYNEIDLTSSVTTSEVNNEDLFLFGELNKESQDLIVISVEPTNNKSARITLVDYGVTSDYNLFTQYQQLTSSFVFESQITLPAVLQLESFGDKTPKITGFVSDESVMERVSKSVYRYNINVAYVNAIQLPSIVESVEVQYDFLDATDNLSTKSVLVPYEKGSANITDVIEGATYKVRARYIGRNGRVGNWSTYSNHTVVGKSNPPGSVVPISVTPDKSSGQLLINWQSNLEVDVFTYEVRTQNINWGANDTYRVFYGDANRCFAEYQGQSSVTYYLKAIDSAGNYSVDASSITYDASSVPNITEIRHVFADTALTNATVTLEWDEITSSEFNVDFYEIYYSYLDQSSNLIEVVKTVKGNSITLPADWVGQRSYTITTVDVHGKKSSGFSDDITKLKPNPPIRRSPQVIDNTVMLYWGLPERTTLPIDHVLLKKGSTWETSELIGEKKGDFTTITETEGGEYTYWLACVDTDKVVGDPVSITTVVSEPPDFVFNAEYVSTFSGTKVNAEIDNGVLVLPVNTTETFAQHFTTRSWLDPEDQVNAGYPIYIQPSETSGYYEEVFDYGQPLASSRITLSYRGVIVAGSPNVQYSISLSLDGVTYNDYTGSSEVFGTNFRYVKIKIIVTASSQIDLYSIDNLTVTLDAKLKNDAGNVYCVNGAGTYSQTLNTITVTLNNHGLSAGKKVFLSFTSGSALTGYYMIETANTNTFTVTSSASQTTSGNVTLDPVGTIVNFNKEFIDVQSINLTASGTTPINTVYDIKDSFVSGTYSITSNVCTISKTDHGFITGQKVKLFIGNGTGQSGIYSITGYTANTFTVDMVASNSTGDVSIYPQSFRIYSFDNSGNRVSSNVSWSIKGY